MFKFTGVAPAFLVADVGATISWYQDELGFISHPFPKKPPYVFASVCRDGIEIMFQLLREYEKPDLHRLRDGGVWDAYIRMEGVKEFYEAIKDKVKIKMSLRQQPYRDWEFEVKDPNGYILVFSELID